MLRTPVLPPLSEPMPEADPVPRRQRHTFGFLMVPDFSHDRLHLGDRAAAPCEPLLRPGDLWLAHFLAGWAARRGVQRRRHCRERVLRGRRPDACRRRVLGHRRPALRPPRADRKLRTLAFYGVSIGAVCTGTYVLAKAGLLAGRKCTIHWENYDSFREEFADIEVTQELFEVDRNRFTCAGGTAAIDMMLSMIAKQKGPEIAAQVTDILIHHRIRDAHERQRMELRSRLGVAHPKLLAVVSEMEKSLETPLSCAELAEEVGLSTRQLERLFRRYIGEAPTKYYLGLRLKRARYLLRQTSMPILTIGLACGFVSASHFSKCYSEHFGRTPLAGASHHPPPRAVQPARLTHLSQNRPHRPLRCRSACHPELRPDFPEQT